MRLTALRLRRKCGLGSNIKQGFTHFAEGDVALAKITPCFQNGKSAVMQNLENGIGAGTTELHIFRPLIGTVEPFYVLMYLKSPRYLSEGEEQMTGTAGQKRVPTSYFSHNPFPLPPLAEQQRIVARVDELMQLCDQLEALEADKRAARAEALRVSLARLLDAPDAATSRARWGCLSAHWPELLDTPASVAPLRQTILGLAVRGQLVSQDDADEPASHLLKQIAAEKARLIAAKKLKKSPPLPPIDANETPFELPESWKWAHIGDVSIIQGGKRLPAGSDFSPVDTPYIYIQVTNMKEGSIVESSLKYIDEDTHKILARYIIEEDDLYITIAGTIGQPGIVPSRFHRMHLTENAAKIVFQGFHKSYFLLALQSSSTQDQFAEKTNQMAQPKLALKRIADALIPLPPLAEQERIVARVDELMALCDRLETELRAAQNASEALGVAAVRRLASG